MNFEFCSPTHFVLSPMFFSPSIWPVSPPCSVPPFSVPCTEVWLPLLWSVKPPRTSPPTLDTSLVKKKKPTTLYVSNLSQCGCIGLEFSLLKFWTGCCPRILRSSHLPVCLFQQLACLAFLLGCLACRRYLVDRYGNQYHGLQPQCKLRIIGLSEITPFPVLSMLYSY